MILLIKIEFNKITLPNNTFFLIKKKSLGLPFYN